MKRLGFWLKTTFAMGLVGLFWGLASLRSNNSEEFTRFLAIAALVTACFARADHAFRKFE